MDGATKLISKEMSAIDGRKSASSGENFLLLYFGVFRVVDISY